MPNQALPHTRWRIAIATAVGAAVAVAVVLLAFLWPSVTSSVHNLPVVVAGEGPAATALTQQLAASGAFSVSTVHGRGDAVAAIESRVAYGAFVADNVGVETIIASAASPVAAQAMNQASAGISAAMAQQAEATQAARVQAALATGDLDAVAQAVAATDTPQLTVTDLVPLNPDDDRGTGLSLLGLPLAMGGMIGGVLISLVVAGFRRRLTAAALYGIVGGLGLVGILQSWLGILSGTYLLNALAMGLGLFAIAMTIVGLESLLGRPGIPIGAVLTMFIGNPVSSLTSPQEFLPWHWGDIGQFFVPGATGTLLRDLSYFPDAATTTQWLVLAGWAAAGLLLAVLGRHRDEVGLSLPATLEAETAPA